LYVITEKRAENGEIRVVPCLYIKDVRVVKNVHFVGLRDAGDPIEAAKACYDGGADEIAIFDITATVERQRTVFDVVEGISKVIGAPLTVGGDIRAVSDIEEALGADRVSISSAAFRYPDVAREAAKSFGPERIIVGIDDDVNNGLPSKREVFIAGGRTPTSEDAVCFGQKMADSGAGELLPTSKVANGVRQGYDIHVTRAVADETSLPVIASGGAGELKHFHEAVVEEHASAVLGASVFHFCVFKIREVKEYLLSAGGEMGL
jgi:cyclase